MRIALALAPTFPKAYPLIGLASLAAVLKRAGHEVTVFDSSASRRFPHSNSESVWYDAAYVDRFASENPDFFPGIAAEIQAFKPDICGFSVWLSNAPASLKIAELLKRGNPRLFTIFGGPEAGFSAERFIAAPQMDAVSSGEGETALEMLAAAAADGKISSCPTPPGVLLKQDGKVSYGGPAAEIKDLDSLPFPDFSVFHREDYLLQNTLPISFNRGCLRRCAFCNLSSSWKLFRKRSAESIYSELKHGVQAYGARYFHIASPAFNADPEMLYRLCDLIIAGGLKIGLGGPAFFSEAMDGKYFKKLAQAGFHTMDFGLESGAPNVLKLMGKNFSAETAERNIRDCFEAGIKTYLNIILGFPGETETDVEITKQFLARNKRWISHLGEPSECIIAQNNLLYRNPEKFGVKPDVEGKWATWEMADGSSNHEIRQARVNAFKEWARKEGLLVSGPVYKPLGSAKNI